MLTLDLGTLEEFNESLNEFIYLKGGIVRFEYSLKALYKWEGKWKKPFLSSKLTDEEWMDFYTMMAIDPFDRNFLTPEVIGKLVKYISDNHTATSFVSKTEVSPKQARSGKFLTSEEIYANMFEAGVDLEFENRNLNRLLVILKIISLHNEPPKKMSKHDIMRQNSNLNEQRKAMLKTKG